jgi:hypothetical protein
MKELSTTIFTNFVRVLGVMALLAFATVSMAFAGNTKTFEFGPGTPQPRSHVRTFPIPCGTPGGVAAVVKFQRLGPAGANNDLPIIIEFREPDTAPDQEGPVVETKTATAKKTEQTVTLRSQSSNRGCTLPWRVRVKYANEGTAPVQAFGTIRLDFDGRLRNVNVSTSELGIDRELRKGQSETLEFGGSAGFLQGTIDITANWNHMVFSLLPGPNPVKLKFELIDPSGAVVKTVEAYSSNEARSGLTRFRLIYQAPGCLAGQWKLRITNIDGDNDAKGISPTAKFTPSCP